jgi:hypothetical protein
MMGKTQGAGNIRATTASRTATGAESSFTVTTITIPITGRPRRLRYTSTVGGIVRYIPGAGAVTVDRPMNPTVVEPEYLDISGVGETDTVNISTELAGAGTVFLSVEY